MMTELLKPTTPLPWKAKRSWEDYLKPDADEAQEYMARPFTRIEGSLESNATVVNAHDCFTFTPGDAEYIVYACNTHPRLVEALEKIAALTSSHSDACSQAVSVEVRNALLALKIPN